MQRSDHCCFYSKYNEKYMQSHCSKFVRYIANQKLLEADKECESYTTGL